jgi:hypothetical protein
MASANILHVLGMMSIGVKFTWKSTKGDSHTSESANAVSRISRARQWPLQGHGVHIAGVRQI